MRESAIQHGATFLSDPLRLREARRQLARLVLEAGCAPGEAHDLAVAFSEASANVYRHAYGGRRDGRVGLHVAIDGERIVLTMDHDGAAFDPATYAPPDLRRPSEGGYGMYLIASSVDEVSFERTPTGGRVVMIKKRQSSSVQVRT